MNYMNHVRRNFTTARPQDIWILGSPLATHGMAGLRGFSFPFPLRCILRHDV